MAKKGTLRFYVANENNACSTLWYTIVNKKGDVYIMSRMMGGMFKVSIHKSGMCHTALTKEYLDKVEANESDYLNRYFDRWTIPTINMVDKMIPLYQIRIPSSELHCKEYCSYDLKDKIAIKINADCIVAITIMKIPSKMNGESTENIAWFQDKDGIKTNIAGIVKHCDGTFIAVCYNIQSLYNYSYIQKSKTQMIAALNKKNIEVRPEFASGIFEVAESGLRCAIELLPY